MHFFVFTLAYLIFLFLWVSSDAPFVATLFFCCFLFLFSFRFLPFYFSIFFCVYIQTCSTSHFCDSVCPRAIHSRVSSLVSNNETNVWIVSLSKQQRIYLTPNEDVCSYIQAIKSTTVSHLHNVRADSESRPSVFLFAFHQAHTDSRYQGHPETRRWAVDKVFRGGT